MKRYIFFALLFTSLASFPMNSGRYHTWFFLQRCMNPANFKTQARIDLLKVLANSLEVEEKDNIVLTNEDLVHQDMLVTGFTSLITPTSAIFCTTMPTNSMAFIDIYTDEHNFNRRKLGEVCRSYFNAKSHGLAYTIPDED